MIINQKLDRFYALFLCLAFAILLVGLGSFGLAETSEARYAEISREMYLSGDFLSPELLGIFHFHKPPITYYITTIGYWLFGVNEFGARFFLQVAVILQLGMVYGLAILIFKSRKTGFISGLVYFSMPIVLISSRNLTTDAYLTTFIMTAIFCWQTYISKGKLLGLYGFFILTGLAILTKGPVALLFVLTYIIAYRILFKNNFRPSVHYVLGLLICLAISVSWYVLVMIENPKLWDYFIDKQIEGRITGTSFSERSKPFWYFIPILLALLLPWLLGLLPDFKSQVKGLNRLSKELKLLLICSAILMIVFSLFRTKLILYILPIFWMIAIFIAALLSRLSGYGRKLVSLGFLVLLSLVSLSLLIGRFVKQDFMSISMFSVVVALVATGLAYVAYHRVGNESSFKPAVVAASFGAALLLTATTVLAENPALGNTISEQMRFVNGVSVKGRKTILVYDYLLTSIPFYTDARYITLEDDNKTTAREVQFENDGNWHKRLYDVHDKAILAKLAMFSKKRNLFLLVRKKRDLKPELSFLKENFKNKKTFDKWTIYYNE